MPIQYLRSLTGKERSRRANSHLAFVLAFVAGATDAGGYLAVRHFSSHMSGLVSSMALNLARGDVGLWLSGFSALLAFLTGAACTAILVNWGRRINLRSEYVIPLLVEAALLISFGCIGRSLEHPKWLLVSMITLLLCFMMGLQNAIITKISQAEIRTTHVTGIVTDIGIELGKLFYRNRFSSRPEMLKVMADRQKLRLLLSLLGLFFLGGLSGALSFGHVGFLLFLPLALLLLILAGVPTVADLRKAH
jgi:Predicted membrane protein